MHVYTSADGLNFTLSSGPAYSPQDTLLRDPSIMKHTDGRYYLDGPYEFVGTGDWSGWGSPLEGQALARLDDGSWRIFLDGYTQGSYFYADSPT